MVNKTDNCNAFVNTPKRGTFVSTSCSQGIPVVFVSSGTPVLKMGIALLWVFLLGFTLVPNADCKAVGMNNLEENGNLSSGEQRIVGGQEAREGQFPFVVALLYNGQFICTASIISSSWILTAAHCVVLDGQRQPPNLFLVVYGTIKRSSPVRRANVIEVKPHEGYTDQTLQNDIALLRTADQMELDWKARPICLNSNTSPNLKCGTSAGWGVTISLPIVVGVDRPPETLRWVSLTVSTLERCNNTYKGQVTNKNICAQSPSLLFSKGVCQGDSGGPFFNCDSQNQKAIQYGIASFVSRLYGCGFPLYVPGTSVYTSVAHFADWIRKTANDNEVCFA